MKKKNLTKRFLKFSWILFLYIALVFGGFILGMIYEQILMTQQLGLALSMTDIKVDVNFNQTKFVEELNNKFIPRFKEAINETLRNQTMNYTK